MQQMDPDLGDRNKDESESTDKQPLAELETKESHVNPGNFEDEKVNLETSAADHRAEEKDLESQKRGSLLQAALDLPNSDASVEASLSGNNDWEYITGLKLILVIVTISMAAFIIWLDTSIVATVSHLPKNLDTIRR